MNKAHAKNRPQGPMPHPQALAQMKAHNKAKAHAHAQNQAKAHAHAKNQAHAKNKAHAQNKAKAHGAKRQGPQPQEAFAQKSKPTAMAQKK